MNALIEKIKAGYEYDQSRNRSPITPNDLPISFEAMTEEWLTAVLCGEVPGAAVTGFRLSAPDNGSSNRRKIYLDYNAAGEQAGLPKAIFCKACHSLANRIVLGVSGGADCEVDFYNDIRPLLDIEAPVSFFAKNDPETYNSMIMLADLTDSVTEFCDPKTVMTRARAESQMRLLGKVHGACYGNAILRQRIGKFVTFRQFFEKSLQFGMKDGSTAGFMAGEEVIPARLFRRHDEIWDATIAALDILDGLPATFTHGDVHLKNWYVAGNGEMALGDWQCSGRAHWGRDVAYTIATALTVENRRAWERDLLAYYLEQMQAAGGPETDFESAWNIYRQQLISALTWWTITLRPTKDIPDMQPRDTTLEFIRRIATAMDDLDSLDTVN